MKNDIQILFGQAIRKFRTEKQISQSHTLYIILYRTRPTQCIYREYRKNGKGPRYENFRHI